MPTRIARVGLTRFTFEVEGIGLPAHGAAGVGNIIAKKGSSLSNQRWAVRVETDDGARGEYVTHWVGTPTSFAQAAMLAPHLIGRDPDTREEIWQDLRREVRAYDHMGHGAIDIALWDLQARRLGTSVAVLLGAPSARACPPTPAPTTGKMSQADSTAPKPSPTMPSPASSTDSPDSRSMAGTMAT